MIEGLCLKVFSMISNEFLHKILHRRMMTFYAFVFRQRVLFKKIFNFLMFSFGRNKIFFLSRIIKDFSSVELWMLADKKPSVENGSIVLM